MKNQRILLVGNGGREHAIAWKLSQSPVVEHVYVAPGNAGTAREQGISNVALTDYDKLCKFARDNVVDFVLIGSEQPLADGLADMFWQEAIPCLGPSSSGAKVESSKIFCKEFARRHSIPTALAKICNNYKQALDYLQQCTCPLVIKADGLAAGKGVIIANSKDEARKALDAMFVDKQFGDAGCRVLIEQFLQGREISFIVLTDGKTILPLASSKDYKKRDEGDKGPNTGGMGAYSPASDTALDERIMNTIIEPVVRALAREGIEYRGFLYAGLMIDNTGNPWLLELNCRLGDPETQALLMRMKSDLYPLVFSAANGNLQGTIHWDTRQSVCLVLAAQGYPTRYNTGQTIDFPANIPEDCKVFHSGTRLDDNQHVLSNGGRVLAITSLADNIASARKKAVHLAQTIRWESKYYRKDIGQQHD